MSLRGLKEVEVQETLATALLALDEDFGEIDGYDVVGDGTYWVVVEDVSVKLVESSGHPRMTWSLRILGPNHFGRRIRRTFVITKTSLRWVKRDLYMCGLGLLSLGPSPSNREPIEPQVTGAKKGQIGLHRGL